MNYEYAPSRKQQRLHRKFQLGIFEPYGQKCAMYD